jgi:hypothetical protein
VRRLSAVLLAIVVVSLAGCAPAPEGVDRRLADDWPKAGEPILPKPALGACATTDAENTEYLDLSKFIPVDSCSGTHVTETFHLGTFAGALGERPSPPTTPADLSAAWKDCGAVAREYLGDDWRTGRVRIIVYTPSATHWSAGARWYRCEVVSVKSENGGLARRTGSARDGLRGARPLAINCSNMHNETADSFEDLIDAPCDQPHKAEFVGVGEVTSGAYPDSGDASEKAFGPICANLAAKFLNVTRAQYDRHQQFNVAWWVVSEDRWALGDRSASCYVTTSKLVSISVRGYGNRNLP